MEIRRLTPSEGVAHRDLMIEASREANDAFYSTAEERAAMPLSFWEQRVAHPDGLTIGFGAFEGEAMVGTAIVEFRTRTKTRHRSRLVGMYVTPSFRGRGLGKQLVEAAIEEARSRSGVRVMTLTATEGNDAAVSLYERCGFQIYGVEPMAMATERGDLGMVCMWLDLRGEDRGRGGDS